MKQQTSLVHKIPKKVCFVVQDAWMLSIYLYIDHYWKISTCVVFTCSASFQVISLSMVNERVSNSTSNNANIIKFPNSKPMDGGVTYGFSDVILF